MARAGISLNLNGFDDLFEKIKKAGGTVDKAAKTCIEKSADTMQAELKEQMQSVNVSTRLINAMPPPKISVDGNRYKAEVGYEKGDYDPRNPSDGYKVVFLNYGTPKRTKHGKVKARGFIQSAKKNARPKIKKQQEETLNDILKELKK